MRNRVELGAYIRFQLSQLSSRNGAHEFEQLCFALARTRHVSNIHPATGPVQAGGDQGLDFETFRTYLKGSDIASSTFLSLASSEIVAGACTLQKRDLLRKIRRDIEIIRGSSAPIKTVIYFCEKDVPVSARHRIQEQIMDDHGIHLILHDGQAISDQLSELDTFWIAEQYLSVPTEFSPFENIDDSNGLRKTQARLLDERTERIESKLNRIAKRYNYDSSNEALSNITAENVETLEVFLQLRAGVGIGWLRKALAEFTVYCDASSSIPVSKYFVVSEKTNKIDADGKKMDPVSLWQEYEHDSEYSYLKLTRTPPIIESIRGVSINIPWEDIGQGKFISLMELFEGGQFGFNIAPLLFSGGIRALSFSLSGARFSFEVTPWSAGGLEALHRLAEAHFEIENKAPICMGTNYRGADLLEMFRSQLDPEYERDQNNISLLSMVGRGGEILSFYPSVPPDFDRSPDSENYKVAIPTVEIIDPAQLVELESLAKAGIAGETDFAMLSSIYRRKGRLSESEKCLRNGTMQHTESSLLQGMLGDVLIELGRHSEAKAALVRCLELDPRSVAGNATMGEFLAENGQFEEALPFLRGCCELEPGNAEFHHNMAVALEGSGDLGEAASSWEQFLSIQPNDKETWIRLGMIYDALDQDFRALGSFERASSADPSDADAHWHAARKLADCGQDKAALQRFERSLSLSLNSDCLISMGHVLAKLHQFAEAGRAFQQALSLGGITTEYMGLTPVDVEALVAGMLANCGELDRAKHSLQSIVERHPDNNLASEYLVNVQQAIEARAAS